MTDARDIPRELMSYLESAPEPHLIIDPAYRIQAANSAYRAKCADTDDFIGRTCYEVSHRYAVPCDQAGESCPMALSLASGRREHVVHLHHTPTGERLESIELAPILDTKGGFAYFVEKFEPLATSRALAGHGELVGRSAPFTHMLSLVARVAPTETTVLLEGASGTGKELLARAIHDGSPRAPRAFVVVDCSGLPETLFESELFGYEKGAFTGATALKPGLIEAADGGTLFLDEVGDIPLAMQVKLLRLIETGTYRRVGGTALRRADVRVVSATNIVLREQVDAGRFRPDLYYRLNTFPIELPRLRERRADLPLLVAALLQRVGRSRTLRLSQDSLSLLMAYDFPGNVRELRNVLERAAVMCDGEVIGPEHLPEHVRKSVAASSMPERTSLPARAAAPTTLRAIEEDTLRTLAAAHRGTRRELARQLGVSERTLYRRLRQLEKAPAVARPRS